MFSKHLLVGVGIGNNSTILHKQVAAISSFCLGEIVQFLHTCTLIIFRSIHQGFGKEIVKVFGN
ncbi:MAG: hypothetical protein IIW19_00170, partial [Clostridia bacterium]|nr:hypothetical protein [Clostridia bacterium]